MNLYLILTLIIIFCLLIIIFLIIDQKKKIKEEREKTYFEIGLQVFNIIVNNFLKIFENAVNDPSGNDFNIPEIINQLIGLFSTFAEKFNLLILEISTFTIDEKNKILSDIDLFEKTTLKQKLKEKSKEIKEINEKINFIKKRVNKYLSNEQINEIYENIKNRIFFGINSLTEKQKEFIFLFFSIFYKYLTTQQNISVELFIEKILSFIKSLFK